MISHEASIVIKRPIEEVFEYLTDARNNPQWDYGVLEVRQTPESPVGIGTRITEVRKFLGGRKFESESEVVQYEPHTKFTVKNTKPFPVKMSLIFESTAEGTKVSLKLEAQPGGFMGMAESLIAPYLRRSGESKLGNLKDLLENQAVATPS